MPDGTDDSIIGLSTGAGDQRNLLMSVAIRSIWPLRWCLSARLIALGLFPFQATCALKRKVFPRFLFWLRDDIARKAAQMVGHVGTGTPLVLVCLALLRSSAGRRRLNLEKETNKSHLAWAASLPGRHKKHAFARCAFVFGGGLRRNAKGRRRVFVPGLAGALQRRRRLQRSVAALFAGARRPRRRGQQNVLC